MGLFSIFKKNKAEEPAPAAEAAAAPAAAPVSNEIPGEVIAAIAAAVACVMGAGAKVVSVRRQQKSGRKAWGRAGLLDNTRPF